MQQDTRQALATIFAEAPNVRLAILFGSLARGDARPDSDVDLAVAGEAPLDAGEQVRLIESVALATGRPVDLVDLRRAGHGLLRQALAYGEPIYCADRAILTEMRIRLLFEREDFAPYQRRLLRERRQAWIGR